MNKLLYLIICLSVVLPATAQTQTRQKPIIRPQYNRPPTASPSSQKSFDKYYFNIGTHTEFFNNVQIDDSGGLRKIDFAPTIGLGLHMPYKESLVFLPEVNWVLPKDYENVISNLLMLRGDLGYHPVDWFRVRFGTSLMWLNQHGRGGKETLNNGSSQSTFYYPDENRSSLNNTLDVGAEALSDNWSLRLQTYIYSVFREDRRQVSYTLFISYYWDRE